MGNYYLGGPPSGKERRRLRRERQKDIAEKAAERERKRMKRALSSSVKTSEGNRTPAEMAADLLDILDSDSKDHGVNPLGHKYLKAVAYRFSRAITIISEMPEEDVPKISTKYEAVVIGLKESGLYGALTNRRKGLGEQITDFEKKFPFMKIGADIKADSY